MSLFWMLVQVLAIIIVAPLFDGIAKKLRARLQSRKGPPDFFQTYRDIQKSFKRGRTRPKCSHWVFRYGPFFMFGTGVAMLAAVPISYGYGTVAANISDIFIVIYLSAMYRFVFGAASIDSGNPFAGVGGSREQMLAVFVEPVMMGALLVVMLVAKTSNIAEIQQMVRSGEIGYAIPAFAVASIAFLWVVYVESGRKPYDLAEAEQELQEGVLGEYSGSDFSIAHAAGILKQFAMIGMFLSIFEPWSFENPLFAIIVFLLKAGVFYVAAVFIDNFGPRYKLLSSLRSNATAALCISFAAIVLYVVGA